LCSLRPDLSMPRGNEIIIQKAKWRAELHLSVIQQRAASTRRHGIQSIVITFHEQGQGRHFSFSFYWETRHLFLPIDNPFFFPTHQIETKAFCYQWSLRDKNLFLFVTQGDLVVDRSLTLPEPCTPSPRHSTAVQIRSSANRWVTQQWLHSLLIRGLWAYEGRFMSLLRKQKKMIWEQIPRLQVN